jgi:hypothetical protein
MNWDLKSWGVDISAPLDAAYIIFASPDEMSRVLRHLKAKYPLASSEPFAFESYHIIATAIPYGDLLSIGAGFPADWLNMAEEAGLSLVVQARSWNKFSLEGIKAVEEDLRGRNIAAFSFNDADLPGVFLNASAYKEACLAWAESINNLNTSLFTTEFYAQNGMSLMASVMEQNVLRLHPIGEREMQTTLNRERAIDRYRLAAAERNMKLLLARFLPQASLEENMSFFADIGAALEDKGLTLRRPTPPPPLTPSPISLALIAIGALGGAWLLARLFHLPLKLCALLLILALALTGFLLLGNKTALYQKLFPLAIAIIFPSLGVIAFAPKKALPIGKTLLKLIAAAGVSFVGAILICGILADGAYMLSLKVFAGVKLAHLAPLVLIGLWFFLWGNKPPQTVSALRDTFNAPVRVKHVCALLLLAGILGLYLLRTGNESLAPAEWEKTLRVFMERVLYARPRLKEFAFGYPLLMLAFYYGCPRLIWPLTALGAVGLISLVNTFAHIHTPFIVSLIRSLNGLILGLIAAAILIIVVKYVLALLKSFNYRKQRQKT